MFWPALAAALWGGLYIASQLAYADVPPATLGLLRLAIGVAALLIAMRRRPLLRSRRHALLGALVAATLLTQSWGTYFSGAATASLLTLMTPVFVAVLAPIFLRERTGRLQWLGIGIGIAGAGVVIGPAGAGSWQGDLLLIAASAAWGLFTVLGTELVRSRGALEVTTSASAWALPIMVVATAIELGSGVHIRVTPGAVADILYLGLGATALGWWAWYRGVEKLPAASSAVPFLLQPVVGVGLSIPIFHTGLEPTFLLGSALVVAGMLVATPRR